MTTSVLFSGAVPLLLFVAKATLLLIVALVSTIPLRRSTAGSRHLVWLAALVGVLALPLLSRVDSLRIGVLPASLGFDGSARRALDRALPTAAFPSAATPATPAAPPAPPSVAPALAPHAPAARSSELITPASAIANTPPSPAAAIPMLSVLALVWSVVALALVGWLVVGTISVRRIVTGGKELTSPDWTMPLCEVADRLDLESPPRLVLSDRIEMAFACRALAPTIVLPAAAESWSDDRRRAVLFHELAHIKRHDLWGHTLGRLACALYWFHPLVWTAAKHLRAESERACDDLVLSCGARPSEYAQHLLEMVTSVRNHGAPIMALPMARKKEFEGRMLAILDPAIRRASPGRLQAAAVVATVGVLSLSVAAVAPAAEREQVEQPAPEAVVAQAPQGAPVPTPRPARGGESMGSIKRTGELQTPSAPTVDRAQNVQKAQEWPTPQPRPQLHLQGPLAANQAAAWTQPPAPSVQGRREVDTARVAMLIRILGGDGDARVRRTAAWALNELRTLDARDALIRAMRSDDDWQVREMAAWSLADYHGDVVTNALVDGLRDKHAKVRQISAWGLGTIGSKRNAGDLEGALSDSDDNVREVAIWGLGQMNIKSAPMLVVNALTDNAKRVRVVAAWTLGEIADPSTANAIVSAFQSEPSTEVRRAEIRALSEMKRLSQTVLDIALKSNDPELRRHAVAELAGDGSYDVWPWPWPWPRPNP